MDASYRDESVLRKMKLAYIYNIIYILGHLVTHYLVSSHIFFYKGGLMYKIILSIYIHFKVSSIGLQTANAYRRLTPTDG